MSAVMRRLGMTHTPSAQVPAPSRLSSAIRRVRVRWYSRSLYLAAVGAVLSQGMASPAVWLCQRVELFVNGRM